MKARSEPKSTGIEVDKTRADYAYSTADEGQTGRVTCWDGKPPNEGDYLILRNGELGNARYKAVKVVVPLGPDPEPCGSLMSATRHCRIRDTEPLQC